MRVATVTLLKRAFGFGSTHVRYAGAAMLISGLAISAAADAASPACGPRDQLLGELAKQYHEAPVALGLDNSGALIVVLASDDGGTWTIVVNRPNGTSCLVASGEEWQALKPPAHSVSSHDRDA